MGGLTINRKRSDEYYTLDCNFPGFNTLNVDNRIDTHISKKQKTSSSSNRSPERPVSVSRIYRYPAPVNPIRREVHAPCRAPKLGFSASSYPKSKAGLLDIMGNVVGFHYDRAKSSAVQSIRFVKQDEEVIDVDAETYRGDVSEDSSVEEVVFVEDDREKVVEGNFQPSSSSVVSDLTNSNLKVDNGEKPVELVSLQQKLELLGLPLHKKLLETAERRDPKLSSLRFQIQLYEKLWGTLQLLHPVKRPEEEDVIQAVLLEPFLPLTKEEEAEVSRAFSNSNRRKVLVTHENSNIEITGEVLQCLRPGAWLNDEVINVYLELLKEREKREPKKFLKCHFFNTFFYKKLNSGRNGYDFKSVRRWTTQRKLGYSLLECDKIFVPIHKEVHWCLAVINKNDQKFQYLDSLGGIDTQVLKALVRYYVDEVKDKSGEHIDVSSWKQEYVEDLPEQENGWDCGVFMIKYADFYSRGLGLCFNQEHMPYFRLRTAKEILRLKAEC